MRGHGFPWSKLLLVLLVFVAGFIAHDVRSNGSVTGLSECRLLTIFAYLCICGLLIVFILRFRFHHSQVSALLRDHSCISAGLEQNNSLLKAGLQVRSFLVNRADT